ncbi:hypothetical protein, partial [Actinoplanes nipponensis]|uniref:hypothetical protein n=1 Tax=Actinoplanes nipponensis TaxID=135950 RepID=UPI0031E8AA54
MTLTVRVAGALSVSDRVVSTVAEPTVATTLVTRSPEVAGNARAKLRTSPEPVTVNGPCSTIVPALLTPSGIAPPRHVTDPGTSVTPAGTVAVNESSTAPAEPLTAAWKTTVPPVSGSFCAPADSAIVRSLVDGAIAGNEATLPRS